MVTLLVGLLIVAVSAFGFGLALFGPRPVPQPATAAEAPHPVGDEAERTPRTARTRSAPVLSDVLSVGLLRRILQREPSADHQPEGDLSLGPATRLRSAVLLCLMVAGLATIIGVIVSVIVVGAVTVLT